MTIRSLSAIFPCQHIQETADWYVHQLGFTKREFLSVSEPHICLYRDNTEIILLQTAHKVIPNHELYGYGYDVYFYTAMISELYSEFRYKGIRFVRDLSLTDYDNREFVIEDPEGRRLAFGLKQEFEIRRVSYDDPDFVMLCAMLEKAHKEIIREQRHPKGNCLGRLDEFNDIFIMYEGKDAAGCAALNLVDGVTAEVVRVFVKPEFRNCGVASKLLKQAEETARSYGIQRLVLDTYERFESAVHLYEKNGYRKMDYTDPESPYSLYMEKELESEQI